MLAEPELFKIIAHNSKKANVVFSPHDDSMMMKK